MLSSLTRYAGCEVGPARHLSDRLPLELLHPFWLPVRGLIAVAQLAHHLGSALDVLKQKGRGNRFERGSVRTTASASSAKGDEGRH